MVLMLMVGGYTSPLPLGSDGVNVNVNGYTSPLPLGSDGVNVNGWWLHFSFTSWE